MTAVADRRSLGRSQQQKQRDDAGAVVRALVAGFAPVAGPLRPLRIRI